MNLAVVEVGKKIGSICGRLLYPTRCPICDDIVPEFGEQICLHCIQKLEYITPPRCYQCGKKLLEEEQEYCKDCGGHKHVFEHGRALYEYQSIAAALYRFKYGGRQEYAAFFGQEIANYLGKYIKEIEADGLIPVPMYASKQRCRGYNQAELLAREIGRQMKIPVYSDLIKRIKNTQPLKKLNPEERQNNLKKAFIIAQNDVKLSTIIIIDDIYTTGSTIDEMSRLLRAEGIQKIHFITLAVGNGF